MSIVHSYAPQIYHEQFNFPAAYVPTN